MEQASSKVQTSVVLPFELRNRLDAEAAKQDRSRSYVTSTAIREYLERQSASIQAQTA
jgi:predicted transcriptional regulator